MANRKYGKMTAEQVVEILNSDLVSGIPILSVSSLRQIHGLNKLEEEEKVQFPPK